MRNYAVLNQDRAAFQRSLVFAIGFTVLLWLVRAVEWGTASDFGAFGILPRHLTGIVGIITAPLIHGTFVHLLSNTFPLLLLLVAIFYFYEKIALEVFVWIYLITGAWVWIAAREAYHIGASGLVYGLATFLFFSGIFRRDARSVAVAVAIAFLYSGMVQGVLPGADTTVSWESHLLGSAAGVFCSFYFRRVKPISKQLATERPENLSGAAVDSTFREYRFRSSSSSSRGFQPNADDSPFERYTFKEKSEGD